MITVNEGGALILTPSFTDETGSPLTVGDLTSPTWSLMDLNGNIINARENQILTGEIVLSCEDLLIGDNGTSRIVLIQGQYDSTSGNGLCLKENIEFTIKNLVGV